MSIQPRCEQCGASFDPLTGGICAACGRMLCGRHLRGGGRSLLATLFPGLFPGRWDPREAAGRCADCRRGPTDDAAV